MNMRNILVSLLFALSCMEVAARDTQHMLPIDVALNSSEAQEKLNQGIQFYFGYQKHGQVMKKMGNFQSNKKANAFGKSDEEACNRAFLSAMLSFQDRAVREGANAVVNIRSYYKKNEVISEVEFECGAGGLMAGVTFTGDVVQLK